MASHLETFMASGSTAVLSQSQGMMEMKASSDVESETRVRLALIGEGTVTTAREVGADLIVVARPEEHQHVSMKSALARVLRNAPRPVLVLPATAADRIRVPLGGRGKND